MFFGNPVPFFGPGFFHAMKFIDEAKIMVMGGRGGDGCVSFRREKYVPRGGPDGGNGGSGGDVILEVDAGQNTLMDLKGRRHFRAGHGQPGGGKGMHGRRGHPTIIKVPPGTLVKDAETGEMMADLVKPKQSFVAAPGGRGGRGNLSFASSVNRAPRQCQSGSPGVERHLILELKLLADVGLIGRPNAGKSTLISKISAARPKVADYPFTTLRPQLGVVRGGDYQSFVVADIPGLIEGAAQGAGMGTKFLRHIERTRLFLHLLDVSDPTQEDPWEAFMGIERELLAHSISFQDRTRWVVLTKADMYPDAEALEQVQRDFQDRGIRCFIISAVSGTGVQALVHALGEEIWKKD